uniref:Uncharacterized protein n=1 Tax=uncultured Candidatus Melainabacteria bacterium TaxID=2682970 RepID=A0A650EKP7_9BACT|nr:hypothetical protein Melaina855_1980 [uncultured Candidatus Melainabacteria bacterium]
MKKIIILTTLILAGAIAYAEVSMPSAPSFGTPSNVTNTSPSSRYKKTTSTTTQNTTPQVNIPQQINTSSNPLKAELDSLAMSILRAAENRDQSKQQAYMMQMMDKGVNQMCPPQIISKKTPHCPPITIRVNNRTLSGSKCALTCYKLNGKQYDVGYCK